MQPFLPSFFSYHPYQRYHCPSLRVGYVYMLIVPFPRSLAPPFVSKSINSGESCRIICNGHPLITCFQFSQMVEGTLLQ
ncbi:hypothetical protein FGO68_gene6565 [Halteria grandinella]|uniref:Uncharacterized protein n=1 Tax=Halteria grandinella TaxID=5974 RepID=A0A8J8NZ90_HALGN|nr:hypothetical protein FGO68_gene6565 [Halteria grandinella]